MNKELLFKEIIAELIEMEEEKVVELCKKSLEMNIPAYETITCALIPGMDEVGRLYEEEEYFLPEVLMCSDAFNSGLETCKTFYRQKFLGKSY